MLLRVRAEAAGREGVQEVLVGQVEVGVGHVRGGVELARGDIEHAGKLIEYYMNHSSNMVHIKYISYI